MALAIADSLEFLPLFPSEDEATILARMEGWANEGLDPSVDADLWVDVREGGHWRTCVQGCARELARFYDMAGTEVPMSGMVLWSWGSYLDDLAAVWNVQRLAATQAGGTVRFTGPEGTVIGAGTTVSTEPAEESEPTPSFEVTTGGTIGVSGALELPVRAVEPGAEGNVAAGAIVAPVTPLPGVTLTNPEPTTGGSDPETDEALVERLEEQFEGRGGGRQRDYRVWARERPGVGHVTVVPTWNGPGTVLVIIAGADGKPTSAETVELLQVELDPVAGQGAGKAPVGATVTVETAALLAITIVGRLDFESGYSLDGFGGTIALEAEIREALEAYIARVEPGGEIVRSQIEGRIAVVAGVHDVGDITINGGAVNLAVPASPPKIPALTALTLTEGTP